MILIIDNYDSFTFNLVQLIGQLSDDICVVRNDKTSIQEIAGMKPLGILISPGPGKPENAGVCIELIRRLGPSVPILGVCLGHQAIGAAFGARISRAPRLVHGKTSRIRHRGGALFANVQNPFEATRYHSLIVLQDGFPSDLRITALTEDNIIMGVRHEKFPIEGIQFHPESILSAAGPQIISNWFHGLKGG